MEEKLGLFETGQAQLDEVAGMLNLGAKIVAALANGPITPEADKILVDNEDEKVHERLGKKMTKAFQAVSAESLKRKVSISVAAYIVAVSRVAEAMRLRGWTV